MKTFCKKHVLLGAILLASTFVFGQNQEYLKNAQLSVSGKKDAPFQINLKKYGFRRGLDWYQYVGQRNKDKAQNTFQYHIDTAVVYSNYVNPQRHIYFYDTAGNKISSLTEFISNGNWEYLSKDSAVYDSVGNPIMLLSQSWNNGTWVNASRTRNRFTTNHNVVDKINETWQNSKWLPVDSAHFIYDGNGNKVAAYHAGWVDSTATWVSKTFQIFSYDSLGNLKLTLYEKWYDTVWMDVQQVLFKYDSASNLIQGLIQYYDDTNWVDFYRETYKYNSVRNRIAYTGQFWKDSLWVNDQQYRYFYNSYGRVETAIGRNWQDTLWVNFEKGQYAYNGYGGIETYLYQQWVNDSTWGNVSLSQYNYDSLGNAFKGDYYSWNSLDRNWLQYKDGLLQIFYNYGSQTTFYTGYHVDVKFNSPLSTGISNKIKENDIQYTLAPNPAREKTMVIIKLPVQERVSVILYDITGKMILNLYHGMLGKGVHFIKLSTAQLLSGLYFVSLSSERRIQTIKLVVKK